jgi:hypothetical protein
LVIVDENVDTDEAPSTDSTVVMQEDRRGGWEEKEAGE